MGARMAECGCQVVRQGLEPIDFCSLHKAAPELLVICEKIKAAKAHAGSIEEEYTWYKALCAVIKKAVPDA